jgi:hypothetical protein
MLGYLNTSLAPWLSHKPRFSLNNQKELLKYYFTPKFAFINFKIKPKWTLTVSEKVHVFWICVLQFLVHQRAQRKQISMCHIFVCTWLYISNSVISVALYTLFPLCSGLGKRLTWLNDHPEQAGLSHHGFGGQDFAQPLWICKNSCLNWYT